jgi:hypothetical protein
MVANHSEAAGAPDVALPQGTPSGQPASAKADAMGTTSYTTPSEIEPITSLECSRQAGARKASREKFAKSFALSA